MYQNPYYHSDPNIKFAVECFSTEKGDFDIYIERNFMLAVKKAKSFYEENKDVEHILYVGVVGTKEDFAIIYTTPTYLTKHLNPLDFLEKRGYLNFLKSGKEFLKTKNIQISKFDKVE